MLTVRAEVENLLDQMRSQVINISDMRDTVHVSAIVRQQSFPDVPQSLVRPFARATLMGAWMQHEARQRGYL